ncbi:transcriptional repressor CTCF [Sitophilus oryzae]|uniref:Transcriptional repressor CTCF n=1 Tax=Sitophilus oryzae TaxID=7048 RepID=A0A6J2YS21_SITOR|nr:transcriptional repressor CTCF [Sitophilus oryzae]XP_030766080.1 transcriptional repressor CTCF [Sitophilus oryzae]XP_030766081.1 transcriptional repressor CTCF [Sitophilus oryzae]XP_030766082.1 transcriptional repressor CTCF [Sitophilus oryzae]
MTTNTQFDETTIKIEDTSENVTEIQSYLAGFQKEIGDNNIQTNSGGEENENETEEGTYFVDQAGHYYFQAKGDAQPVMTVMSALPQQAASDEGDEYIINADNEENETNDDQEERGPSNENQILINSGNAFQRVTVVPADNNSGELSYVLIVQDPDLKDNDNDEDEDDQDMAVYDFDDQDGSVQMDSDAEDDKSKIVKVFPRKSQSVSQAHMCNYCNYTSSKRYLLSRHMKSHSEERPHKCSVCERGFKTLASLQNHVNTHTGTKPHACSYCEAAFTTSGELVRHVRYRHTHEKPHKCSDCDYASVELSKLKRHIRCHTGERPYQCPHCTYASPDTFKLKRHLRIHTGEKPYVCDICSNRFTQSNSLKAHKLTHNIGDKPIFQCALCPTTCGRKTDLRIHVQKLHTSDKPLKCRRCGKSFPDRYSYKLHNKSHEGEKCFKCDLCPYASTSARHLESHMLIHTDQKPYECDLCDHSFRQKQLLRRHQNLYHNPEYIPPKPRDKTHECPECSRTFTHKGNLLRHMAAHDPDPQIQQKQLELKLGRQKKIQMIDGQQVEVISPGLASDEEEEIDMMAVEGSDGQQYVVLEVIQLAEGEEQAMVVGSENSDGIVGMDGVMQDGELDDDVIKALQSARRINKASVEEEEDDDDDEDKKPDIATTEADMQNCFGFDEEEEDDQRETLTLLSNMD